MGVLISSEQNSLYSATTDPIYSLLLYYNYYYSTTTVTTTTILQLLLLLLLPSSSSSSYSYINYADKNHSPALNPIVTTF